MYIEFLYNGKKIPWTNIAKYSLLYSITWYAVFFGSLCLSRWSRQVAMPPLQETKTSKKYMPQIMLAYFFTIIR